MVFGNSNRTTVPAPRSVTGDVMPIASARWLACFVAVLALQMPSVAFSRDFVLTIGGGYSPQGNQEG